MSQYSPATKETIVYAILNSPAPIPTAELANLARLPLRAVRQILAEEIAAARVFAWGPKTYWHRDAKAVARERILAAVAEAAEPIAAAVLVSLPGVVLKAAELPPLLAEDVASGRVFVSRKKYYWHRDPASVAREVVVRAIEQAAEPVAAAELLQLSNGVRKAGELPRLLAEHMAAGRVFAWGKNVYWHSSAKSVARSRILDLAGREDLSKDALMSRAAAEHPVIDTKVVRAVCASLIKELALVDVLKPVAGRVDGPVAPRPISVVIDVAERMFAALHRIAFAPGTTVTFPKLRRDPELAHVDKEAFDEAALSLQRDGRALLTVHGHASSLPAEERDALVTDGLGTYYASIYSR